MKITYKTVKPMNVRSRLWGNFENVFVSFCTFAHWSRVPSFTRIRESCRSSNL